MVIALPIPYQALPRGVVFFLQSTGFQADPLPGWLCPTLQW
jgi:hypothetical protein